MLRSVVLAALALATAAAVASAEPQPPSDEAPPPLTTHDRFVVSGDACGASRYQHLLGREYAQVYQAALLPADAIVQNRNMLRTLEYTPHRLNVVLGGEGRIIAIGCF